MEKSVGFTGSSLHFRYDILIALFQLHPDVRKDIGCPSEVIRCFMEGLVPQISAHHRDQYHEVPVLLCPLLQTVNAVGVPTEIQTFGFFPISKPKKYPNLFLNLPDLQAIQNRKGLDIF